MASIFGSKYSSSFRSEWVLPVISSQSTTSEPPVDGNTSSGSEGLEAQTETPLTENSIALDTSSLLVAKATQRPAKARYSSSYSPNWTIKEYPKNPSAAPTVQSQKASQKRTVQVKNSEKSATFVDSRFGEAAPQPPEGYSTKATSADNHTVSTSSASADVKSASGSGEAEPRAPRGYSTYTSST